MADQAGRVEPYPYLPAAPSDEFDLPDIWNALETLLDYIIGEACQVTDRLVA